MFVRGRRSRHICALMESNGNPISMPPQEDLTEVRKPTSLLVAQFFLFPLIVIAFGVGIFLLFGYITYDQKSPQVYLNEIRLGSDTRRWQAAFELSKVIAGDADLLDTGFAADVLRVYENSRNDDPRIRQFLAMSLAHLADPVAVPALVEGLDDSDVDTKISTLWALGAIADRQAAPGVAGQTSNEDASVRKMAVYVLGVLKDPSTMHELEVALNDTVSDVRWNAAMSLAQMDNDAGADVLLQLTDRTYLSQFAEMAEADKNNAIVNALKCLGLLKLEGTRTAIALLSENDPSLLVRDAALAALNTF